MVHFGNSVAQGTLPLTWETLYSFKKKVNKKNFFLLLQTLRYIILPAQTDHLQISGQ